MKTGLLVAERFATISLVACAVVWGWNKTHPKQPERIYKFRGEFCGVELWEYSASGAAVTIWNEFQTNVTQDGIVIRSIVKTNTYENYLKSR